MTHQPAGEHRRCTVEALDELEQRVVQKWAAAAATRTPHGFDPAQWSGVFDATDRTPLPPDVPQFPREQWASYPTGRMVTLLMCEKVLDRAAELTDDQWMTLCLAMQYGGKTRLT